jgi:phosphatidate cytidylyltransferase
MPETPSKALVTRVAVGLALGGVFLLSLVRNELFLLLILTFIGMATWELSTAMRRAGWIVPRVPTTIGALAIVAASFLFGFVGQWFAFLAAATVAAGWRLVRLKFEPPEHTSVKRVLRDLASILFVLIYVPLLMSFITMLINRPNGVAWVFGVVLTVVTIDSAGYLVGRVFGRTQLAPGVSPKKSWEGLSAGIVGALLTGQITAWLVGGSLVFGVVFSFALILSAVLGDLSESLIKRDLDVKDMSSALPGHGGILDRIDSHLPSSFMGFMLSLVVF